MTKSASGASNKEIQGAVSRIRKRIDHSTTNDDGSRFTYVIGNNGIEKSRILAELARQYDTNQKTRIDHH